MTRISESTRFAASVCKTFWRIARSRDRTQGQNSGISPEKGMDKVKVPPYVVEGQMEEEKSGGDSWAALLFTRAVQLSGYDKDHAELGRVLAAKRKRKRPYSRQWIEGCCAGLIPPPLPVWLDVITLARPKVRLRQVVELAPDEETAEEQGQELRRAVGSDVKLRVVVGRLALGLVIVCGVAIAFGTRSSNPQVWVKAAQQVIHSSVEGVSPSTTTAEASGSAQGSKASHPIQNVAYVDADDRPSPTPSPKPTGVGSKPASNSASASVAANTSQSSSASAAANYDAYSAEMRARLRAAAQVYVATHPTPTPTPTPAPTPDPTPAPPPPAAPVAITATNSASTP